MPPKYGEFTAQPFVPEFKPGQSYLCRCDFTGQVQDFPPDGSYSNRCGHGHEANSARQDREENRKLFAGGIPHAQRLGKSFCLAIPDDGEENEARTLVVGCGVRKRQSSDVQA